MVGESLRTNAITLSSSRWINYDIEGSYYVTVQDESTGAIKTSKTTRVSVTQMNDVCRARKYGMEYNQYMGSYAQDQFYNGFGPDGSAGRLNVRGW